MPPGPVPNAPHLVPAIQEVISPFCQLRDLNRWVQQSAANPRAGGSGNAPGLSFAIDDHPLAQGWVAKQTLKRLRQSAAQLHAAKAGKRSSRLRCIDYAAIDMFDRDWVLFRNTHISAAAGSSVNRWLGEISMLIGPLHVRANAT